MRWLDKIPYSLLVPMAILLALLPFQPEPHLWEKLKMLFAGTLVRPIDILDLCRLELLPVEVDGYAGFF